MPASVPLVNDMITSEEDRRILDLIFVSTTLARPYVAPPGLPPERAATLRTAFMATMRDAEVLAEMAKFNMSVDPLPGDEMQRIVADAYTMPAPMVGG